MSIPDYQSLMLPILETVSDEKVYKVSEVRNILAERFHLTPDQRRELLPSGTQPIFDNRVAWAKTYLVKAHLLEAPKRAHIEITSRGKDILKQNPDSINVRFLKQFEEFNNFIAPNVESESEEELLHTQNDQKTPIERLDAAYNEINQNLAKELKEHLKNIDPYQFEILVLDLLQAIGYGGNREEAARVTRKSGDGGIDGIINEDRLGLDKIYVQAKKWEGNVTISAIRDFGGTLLAHSAQKGIFITTSDFPKTAIEYCERIDRTIVLINGRRLAELMIEFNIGISSRKTYVIKEVDSDYFEN
ncbi:restriction endonuclease [Roseimarinus sediminis]|uniref:restriction endonuclease n=1 Tax=Roseimarinus sediminis TaxID=1610899 RepID=UPI003D21E286